MCVARATMKHLAPATATWNPTMVTKSPAVAAASKDIHDMEPGPQPKALASSPGGERGAGNIRRAIGVHAA